MSITQSFETIMIQNLPVIPEVELVEVENISWLFTTEVEESFDDAASDWRSSISAPSEFGANWTDYENDNYGDREEVLSYYINQYDSCAEQNYQGFCTYADDQIDQREKEYQEELSATDDEAGDDAGDDGDENEYNDFASQYLSEDDDKNPKDDDDVDIVVSSVEQTVCCL